LNGAVLLDTDTLFWLDTEPERLSPNALARLGNRSIPA
jgi:PIN domain nuclease of toxin-antitoxin system